MAVRDLRDCDARFGGKAAMLARLIAAGLRVPEGFAIEGGDGDRDGVEARAAGLGQWLAVRSSAAIEDGDDGAAAGVFASRCPVAAAALAEAIRAVQASARAAVATDYARRRGVDHVAVAVIVQRYVAGARATVYTRPPGHPDGDDAWVQRDGGFARVPRGGGDPLVDAALDAERAIAAPRGADVELVVGADGLPWIVQARPIVHRPPVVLAAPPDDVLAPLRDGRTWTWDVAHNPDPLSPAQLGLVERVARVGRHELRGCAGYLYTAPRADAPPPPRPPRDAGELAATAARLEHAMVAALGAGVGALAEALDRYVAFYRAWCELADVLAAARHGVGARATAHRPSAVEVTLARAARGELAEADAIESLGALSPAWDVAVPTYAEQPDRIRDAIARLREASPQLASPPDVAPADDLAALVADLGERDDLLFARAQQLVRRAILGRAAELGIAGEDACWISLDGLLAGAATGDPAAARSAAARAAGYDMPLVIGPDPAGPLARSDPRGPHLVGHGSGGHATGRVVRFASLAAAISVRRGDVVVTRAITPALAILVAGCAALVSETGGPLDHGAAMARELGIPSVVGCTGAWSQLADGTMVLVDGEAGLVEVTR